MKTSHSLALAAVAGVFASACSGGGGESTSGSATGVPLTPGAYYNLIPGTCAEYAPDGGAAAPYIGVHILASTSPAGIELMRERHHVTEAKDFLSFAPDGGAVFLTEREYSLTTSIAEEVYSSPLTYLPQPPLGTQTLDSSSLCAGGSACTTMSLDVSVASTNPYTRVYSVPDGGLPACSTGTQCQSEVCIIPDGGAEDAGTCMSALVETHLDFIFQYNDDAGAQSLVEGALVPGIGFTDLLLPDDTGNYTDFLLVDIIPDDAGCADH